MAEYRDEHYQSGADYLAQNKGLILQRWEERVKKGAHRARRRVRPVLREAFSLFLVELERALRAGKPVTVESQAGSTHKALSLCGAGVSSCWMQEVVQECAILHRLLFDLLESEVTMSLAEQELITASVFSALEAAAMDYARNAILNERALQNRVSKELEHLHVSADVLEDSLCKEREVASEAHKELDQLHLEGSLRDSFIATLSHDLRNPLIVARASLLRLLRHPEKPEDRSELLARAVACLDRAETMIRDLLDVTQIHAGHKLILIVKDSDLRATLDGVIADLALLHGNRFVIEAPKTLLGAWDCDAVGRAIENLATNAIKYGSEETPVTIALKECGETVEVSIHNKGNPLQASEMEGLFDPFHRTTGARKSGKRGWGLGLLLVRSIAEAHGGGVRVSSGAEAGTTFTITLPRFAKLASQTPE